MQQNCKTNSYAESLQIKKTVFVHPNDKLNKIARQPNISFGKSDITKLVTVMFLNEAPPPYSSKANIFYSTVH